ncbi:MAG: hypothetical protein Kow00124_15890 [Anaerolineae bacterium]
MAYSIRVATHADHTSLAEVIARLDALDETTIPQHLRQPRLDLTLLALIIDPDAGTIFIAEEEGEMIGFVVASIYHAPGSLQPRATINALAVDTTHQQVGLGRVLMARVHRWARDRGAARVELRAPETAGAATFYESLGYIPMGPRRMVRFLEPR